MQLFTMKLARDFALSLLLMMIATAVIFTISNIGNDALGFGMWVVLLTVLVITPIIFLIWMLPLHLLFQRLHMRSLKVYVLVGIIPGPVLFGLLRPLGEEPFWSLVYHSAFAAAVGAVGAAAFYYLSVHRNKPVIDQDKAGTA